MKLPNRTGTFCERTNYGALVHFHFRGPFVDSQRVTSKVVKPVEMQEVASDEITEPAMVMHAGDVQTLMDELWRVGFRPSEGSGSAGSLAATERHLKDMRTIVMHQLQIDQKGNA